MNDRICEPCREGFHPHDRWAFTAADAGCPNVVRAPGDIFSECACPVVVTPLPARRCPTCGRAS